jgi:hypothetical protein
MSRQDAVIQALIDGFGEERISAKLETNNYIVQLVVDGIEGYFEIDAAGDVTKIPVGLSGELAYWIHTDLKCLDLLAGDEMIKRLEA